MATKGVLLAVGVWLAVGVLLAVGVFDGVGVLLAVGVRDGVSVLVGVNVSDGVSDGGIGVGVFCVLTGTVSVEPPPPLPP